MSDTNSNFGRPRPIRDADSNFWGEQRREHFLVVGAGGVSGAGIARLFRRMGVPFKISDALPSDDIRQLAFELELEPGAVLVGPQEVTQLEAVTQIVTAPGVPRSSDLLRAAKERGIPVWCDFDLLYPLYAHKQIAAITGTDGKTTTTQLLGHLLSDAKSTLVAGNTGTPISAVYDALFESEAVVFELSSFMLEDLKRFRANVSTVLNVAQDHVDRYIDLREYAEAKSNIVRYAQADDVFLHNIDDPTLRDWRFTDVRLRTVSARTAANYCLNGTDLRLGSEHLTTSCLQLRGQHLYFDAMVAAAMAIELGIDVSSVISRLQSFVGVPHRFEFVAQCGRVDLIDDSKATTVHAVVRALESLAQRQMVLILGGRDKMLDPGPLRRFASQLRAIVGYGEAGRRMLEYCDGVPTHFEQAFDDAVRVACRAAQAGDVLLLSPGCTSFDQHRDYRERGERFRCLAKDYLSSLDQRGDERVSTLLAR